MNERMKEWKEKAVHYWSSFSKKNKIVFISLFFAIVLSLSLAIYFVSAPKYVPLYTNELSQKEVGDIKAELDRQGYTEYKLENQGTQILVPQKDAANLLVSLAAKGLPKTGSISFSDMTKDLKFGATDRQLDAMEREALQGQIEDLLKHVDGVKDAQVVLSLPKESLFVRPDDKEKASASVVIELSPGYTLEPKQIQTLYHLVSKSIPNLPKDNIVMTDQYGQGLDIPKESDSAFSMDQYQQQRNIQREIETDIQQKLQQMLGTIIGKDKVLVQAFVRLNFDQVKTKENLVEPVNKDTNEGIAISAEKISKTYSGEDKPAAGVSGTGQTDVNQYPSSNSSQTNKSEDIENRVNYEVNRITKDIVQSPYQMEDITINVGVEPPDPKDPSSLTPQMKSDIQNVLSNVVRAALSNKANITDQDINSRIAVLPREFSEKPKISKSQNQGQPWWVYGLIALATVLFILVIFLLLRARKSRVEYEDLPAMIPGAEEVQAEEKLDESVVIKKQVEQMAQQQPKEVADLLRTWLVKNRL
jgi:flagellar M-ring protein FliF